MSDCQGWTNYETWAVNLWMDNEESDQRFWAEEAKRAWEKCRHHLHPIFTGSQNARYELADTLKTTHEARTPEFPSSVYSDLLGAALSSVNWDEIANTWLENHAMGYTPIASGNAKEVER